MSLRVYHILVIYYFILNVILYYITYIIVNICGMIVTMGTSTRGEHGRRATDIAEKHYNKEDMHKK